MGTRRLFACLAVSLTACVPPAEQPPVAPIAEAPIQASAAPLAPEAPPSTSTQRLEPAPEAHGAEPGITRTNAPTRGTLPQSVVEEKLASAGPGIKACYERALEAKPDLRGYLSIDFVVAPDGTVGHAQAREVDQPLDDADTVDCILDEIRKLEFPQPNGGRVFLNYPLSFQPPEPAP